MHEGVLPNIHTHGSVQIDFPLITAELAAHVLDVGLLDGSVLQIDHSGFIVDLRIKGIFGQYTDKLAPLDDPIISNKYQKNLHK
jgi:hypothetical protein